MWPNTLVAEDCLNILRIEGDYPILASKRARHDEYIAISLAHCHRKFQEGAVMKLAPWHEAAQKLQLAGTWQFTERAHLIFGNLLMKISQL